ncbi:MAG: hypothetical protein H0U21_09205 [Acidimicrobiia bacterium]|nr:hypothetical protein [Acidimicrobiia bacterium]
MNPGPLPPHERPWRHPSELPPPPHEPTTTAGRLLILSSATLSLLLIGALAVTVTPGRGPATVSDASSATPGGQPASFASVSIQVPLPMATPVGDGHLALTTLDATVHAADWVNVQLPSGRAVRVEVVRAASAGGIAVVVLPDTTEQAVELAIGSVVPTDTVLVDGPEPTVIALSDLVALDVDDGTPVLDASGALVGLCYRRDGRRVELMPVETIPVLPPVTTVLTVASTDPPAATEPQPSTIPSSVPTSTSVDSSTPTTSVPSTTDATDPTVTSVDATPSTG